MKAEADSGGFPFLEPAIAAIKSGADYAIQFPSDETPPIAESLRFGRDLSLTAKIECAPADVGYAVIQFALMLTWVAASVGELPGRLRLLARCNA